MKKELYFFSSLLFVFLIFFSSQINAQVTNLVVNGVSPGSNFTMESGGAMSWQFNVPNPGDTALIEIWLDLNNSRSIDTGDKLWQSFNQIDGDPQGQYGAPDMDGVANGSISLINFLLGLAPTDYIMKATNKGVGQMVAGTITPLATSKVAYAISGKVIVPTGVAPSNISVELSRNQQYKPSFWDALTDAQGNYTIKMTSDTAGNPWGLSLRQGQFNGFLINPSIGYQVTVDANKTNMDFTVTAADAKVVGILKKEDGTPVPFNHVTLFYILANNSGQFNYYVGTDANGLFQFGVTEDKLTGQEWILQAGIHSSDTTENYMDARVMLNPINKGDSVYKVLTLYAADTTITGKVSFQTNIPFGNNNSDVAQILLMAHTDSTESYVHNNTTTGDYTLRVSSKSPAYSLFGVDLPQGYDPITLQNIAPGATNVNFNYTLTDVKERTSEVPKTYLLSQNYPNPFNPTTNINYDIPNASFVNIVVYNDLGQMVMTLVNKEQKTGKYVVSFNARKLSSGIYYYQIKANEFVQTKKMILLK